MKVKFSKLAALLLAGVALLAAGCTDYEVDIQKVDKKVDELEVKTAANLKAQVDALTAMISAVEQNYKDADAALKKQLEDQINDLKDQKLDKSTFETYKKETAETIKLLSDGLKQIQDNYATKKELQDAMDEISKQLNDYVLKSTFDEFVELAATKKDLEDLKAELEKELADAKDEMVEKLNKALEEVNGKLEDLDERVTVLESAVASIVDELAFADGDLQAYIDDADAAVLDEAIAYTDEWCYEILDYIDELMWDVWNAITVLQQRMQSIVFVPDYDDLKITVNMAYLSQEVEPAELARAEGVVTEKNVAVVDQPFKVQYKFLPAKYAVWVANAFDEILEYDVKPVNTRAEEVEEENAPSLQILAAEYDDDVDETGIITFTVLPVNIASAQFAANGLKPNYEIGLWAGGYVTGWNLEGKNAGFFSIDERDVIEENGYNVLTFGVWNVEDLENYQARTAFAASMRLKYQEPIGTGVYHYYYGEVADDYYPEYNEIASTYNVLYPDATEIEILADPYKPELDEDGNVVTDEEGNTVLVKAVPEYQYLPYSALRENPVGEKENQDPQGYRIILDQVVPGVEIDGTVYTVEDAAKKGYILPAIETVFDEFTYDAGTAAEVDEENFKETAQVYAEIEMNPEKSAALRKLAVGNVITGWYHFETPIGETPFCGQVEITKPQGEVKVNAEIVWTYSLDADMDHEIFYNDAEPAYARVELPVNVDEESAATLEKNLGVTIEDFRQAEASNVKIVYTDEEGNEVDATEDITIENVAIDEDGNLTMDITGFDWDKVYTITADYELEAALVNVIGTLTTVDRNRELMVINMPEYAVVLNGENYDAETDTYTTTPEEGDFLADLFKLFVDRAIINQNDPKDFDDAEAFLGEQTGKEGHLEAYEPEEGENSEYVTIGDDYAVLTLTSPQLYEVWKAGEALTSFVTSYIGQEIEIIWPVTVDLPGYNFLHLNYYTFNTEKETANFITKRDFSDNDGSVIWWSQVYPSYFTTVKSENETEGEAQNRNSNRYALADYDVAYINLAELAFNVVDEKDNILDDEAIEEANLVVKFVYTDETLGEKELPEVDQIEDFVLYESLWVDNTVFYYRTNEKKFIPARGTLGVLSGETVFELPTRFDEPKASVEYPSENLDYSTYAIVRWTPFQAPKAEGYTIVLDENLVYQVPLFKGMELKDNRPNGVSFYVIKDGEWVIGDAAENATASSKTNGYIEGIAANEAYHITTDFAYDTSEIPAQLKKLLSIEEIDGVPYVIYDYTSEVQFHGVLTIPVVVALENPWQETIKFVYDITIKGIGD